MCGEVCSVCIAILLKDAVTDWRKLQVDDLLLDWKYVHRRIEHEITMD